MRVYQKENNSPAAKLKRSAMRSAAYGLSAIALISVFGLTGCSAKAQPMGNTGSVDNTENMTVVDTDETNNQIEFQQESMKYMNTDAKTLVNSALRYSDDNLYEGIKVTKYAICPQIFIYQKADNSGYVMYSGNQKVDLVIDEDNMVVLPDGETKLSQEGFRSAMNILTGKAKEDYEAQQKAFADLDKSTITVPTVVYDGIQFEDENGTDAFAMQKDGKMYINLAKLADLVGFEYTDNSVGDVENVDTLDGNKNYESVTLSGFDGNLGYTFLKNTNKVIVKSEYADELARKEAESIAESQNKETGSVTPETMFLNVGSEPSTTVTYNNFLYVPVEYLTSAFDIAYTIEGNIITLDSGRLLPENLLLDTKVDVGFVQEKAEEEGTEVVSGDTLADGIKGSTKTDQDKTEAEKQIVAATQKADQEKAKADKTKDAQADKANEETAKKATEEKTTTKKPTKAEEDAANKKDAEDLEKATKKETSSSTTKKETSSSTSKKETSSSSKKKVSSGTDIVVHENGMVAFEGVPDYGKLTVGHDKEVLKSK